MLLQNLSVSEMKL